MFNCIFLKGIRSEELSLEDQEKEPVGETRPSHHGTVGNLTEELLGEDGTFEECEAEPDEEVVQACGCC